MKMKRYKITDEISGRSCVTVEAANEASALKKYRKGLMSSGFYELVTEKDDRPRLVSSFGSCFRADRKTAVFIDGDLVENADIGIFCHQTNCFGKMGAGIARQIAAKYRAVAEKDREYCRTGNVLGTILCVPTGDGRTCVNMYAQYGYGTDQRQTDYFAFDCCLQELEKYLQTVPESTSIGFPDHIGCGLAGGDWDTVLPMLEQFASRVSQPVYIVRYVPERGRER